MKLYITIIFICSAGIALCETPEQQLEYADRLVDDIEDAANDIKELMKNYDETTDDGKHFILLHANALNFNVHHVLDCLQSVAIRNEAVTLQDIVLKLNNITYELEKSFKTGVSAVKTQLQTSVKNIVQEARNLRKAIRESIHEFYAGTILKFLDNLVSAVQGVVILEEVHNTTQSDLKSLVGIAHKLLNLTLSNITSTNENVYNDIARYSSRFSSEVGGARSLIKSLVSDYKTDKYYEVKEILHNLGHIIQANEDTLYKEKTLNKVIVQFQVSLARLTEQLDRLIDAAYSDEKTVSDENLMYIVLPKLLGNANKLQRNLERTINNYIAGKSSAK